MSCRRPLSLAYRKLKLFYYVGFFGLFNSYMSPEEFELFANEVLNYKKLLLNDEIAKLYINWLDKYVIRRFNELSPYFMTADEMTYTIYVLYIKKEDIWNERKRIYYDLQMLSNGAQKKVA